MSGPVSPAGRPLTEAEVLKLAASGMSAEDLAARMHVTPRRAATLIDRSAKRSAGLAPGRDEQVRIEVVLLNTLQLGLMSAAGRGDVAAARAILRVSEHRSRLLRLIGDTATKAPVPGEGDAESGRDDLDRVRRARAARLRAGGAR